MKRKEYHRRTALTDLVAAAGVVAVVVGAADVVSADLASAAVLAHAG